MRVNSCGNNGILFLCVARLCFNEPSQGELFFVAKDKPTGWTRKGRGGKGGVFLSCFVFYDPCKIPSTLLPLLASAGGLTKTDFARTETKRGVGGDCLPISFSFFFRFCNLYSKSEWLRQWWLLWWWRLFDFAFRPAFLFRCLESFCSGKWTEKNAGFY